MKKGGKGKRDPASQVIPALPPIDDAYVQAVKIQSLEERYGSALLGTLSAHVKYSMYVKTSIMI
jgi:hypothetical protein